MAGAAGGAPNFEFMFGQQNGATSGNDVIDQLQQIQQFMAQQTGIEGAGATSPSGQTGPKNPEAGTGAGQAASLADLSD